MHYIHIHIDDGGAHHLPRLAGGYAVSRFSPQTARLGLAVDGVFHCAIAIYSSLILCCASSPPPRARFLCFPRGAGRCREVPGVHSTPIVYAIAQGRFSLLWPDCCHNITDTPYPHDNFPPRAGRCRKVPGVSSTLMVVTTIAQARVFRFCSPTAATT